MSEGYEVPTELPGSTDNLYNSILLLHCLMVYYIVSGLFLLFFWCPCMESNGSVQHNGGFFPDIILLEATRLGKLQSHTEA